MIRRRRLDLELLLIIRRAERQAHLRGRSRSGEPDAVIGVHSTERVTRTDVAGGAGAGVGGVRALGG